MFTHKFKWTNEHMSIFRTSLCLPSQNTNHPVLWKGITFLHTKVFNITFLQKRGIITHAKLRQKRVFKFYCKLLQVPFSAKVYFARMLFCSLKNAHPYSLAKCSPKKMLFMKRAFCEESILTKNIGEHFWETKRAFSKKMLSFTPLTLLFCQIALQKEKYAKRAFARGVQERNFKRATKWQPFVTAGAAQLERVKKNIIMFQNVPKRKWHKHNIFAVLYLGFPSISYWQKYF